MSRVGMKERLVVNQGGISFFYDRGAVAELGAGMWPATPNDPRPADLLRLILVRGTH